MQLLWFGYLNIKSPFCILVVKEFDISYFHIFWQADFVGKSVLVLLSLASCYVWGVIFSKIIAFFKLSKAVKEFCEYVRGMPKMKRLIVDDVCMHFQLYDQYFLAYAYGHGAGYIEENKQQKLNAIMDEIVQTWEVRLEKNLDYLSIIGSIAPFVGLFGTVWGIMNSFQSIALSNSSSIAVVAPGISEALFATALGLVVAIPAAIATHIFYAKIEALIKDLKLFGIYAAKRLDEKI